jgi:hypothetical protein
MEQAKLEKALPTMSSKGAPASCARPSNCLSNLVLLPLITIFFSTHLNAGLSSSPGPHEQDSWKIGNLGVVKVDIHGST